MVYFWVRQQVRKYMKPIPLKTAEEWSKSLTAIYVLTAWCACGIMIYKYAAYKDKMRANDPSFAMKEKLPGLYYGRVMQAQNMHMFSFEGGKLSKVGVYQPEKDDQVNHSDIDFFGEEIVKKNVDDED